MKAGRKESNFDWTPRNANITGRGDSGSLPTGETTSDTTARTGETTSDTTAEADREEVRRGLYTTY